MCICDSHRTTFFQSSLTSGSYSLPNSLSRNYLGLGGVIQVYQSSADTCSLHFDQLWVSLCINHCPLYQEPLTIINAYVDHPGALNQINLENEGPIDEHMKAKIR